MVLALPLLSGCGKARYCCMNNVPVQIHGTRKVLSPAGDWGGKLSIQDPWILEAINGFFAEHAAQLGLPGDIRSRSHNDGVSLVYVWTGESGLPNMLVQSARPSLWFNIISLNGRLFNAQERDWGFVATPRFARDHRENRAITIVHEFWHQYTQIRNCGVLRYWLAYAGQVATHSYFDMPFEQQAYCVSDMFEKYIASRYGIVFKSKSGGRKCRPRE